MWECAMPSAGQDPQRVGEEATMSWGCKDLVSSHGPQWKRQQLGWRG